MTKRRCPPSCSLTENASRAFLAQFVGDAGAGQPHELGERPRALRCCLRFSCYSINGDGRSFSKSKHRL